MRIRSIRPEFWRSDDITGLSREHRLLFIGLWSYVDDNGVGVDDYRLIAADLFPLEDDQKEIRDYVREGLATLSRALLVVCYAVDGRSYLFIPTWDLHQRIDRPGKARYPRPPEDWKPPTCNDSGESLQFDGVSRDSRDSLDAGEGEKGRRGEVKDSSSATATPPADSGVSSDQEGQRDDVDALCARLHDWMIQNEAKPPTVTKRWRQQARLLLDQDKRELSKALNLIDWCQQDSFWMTNIHSIPTFREKYDQLAMKAREEWRRNGERAKAQADSIDTDKNPWAGTTWVV